MLKVKSTVEFSDKDYAYWDMKCPIKDIIGNATEVMLYGNDVVNAVFGQPLEHVVGCTTTIDGVTYRANYRYSSICERQGRAKAFYMIENNKPQQIPHADPALLTSVSQLGNTVSFDIETGGSSGIRCISFYDGVQSYYVDCRGLRSDKQLRALLTDLFTSPKLWIAHYGIHDMKIVCDKLKIPYFPLYADTIWFNRDVEYRSLRYLSGVYLGVPAYKQELQEANLHEDFNQLVKYCCKDSVYTWMLAHKMTLLPMQTLNQVYYTMLHTDLGEVSELFDKYPDLRGLTKKQLKDSISKIDPRDLPLLQDQVRGSKPLITVHGLEGLHIQLPRKPHKVLYMKSYASSPLEVMAMDRRYDSAELSVYRYNNGIEPTLHYFHCDCPHPFLVNHCCVVTEDNLEGWTTVSPDEVYQLFNQGK
jgi:hypothetical protein